MDTTFGEPQLSKDIKLLLKLGFNYSEAEGIAKLVQEYSKYDHGKWEGNT